jgi:hypothetical protein
MRTLARHILMIVAVYTLAMFILGFTAGRVRANDHHPLHHDFYRTWMQPNGMGSCCNARVVHPNGGETGDCEPTEARLIAGRWYARLPHAGAFIEVPDSKVIRERNPTQGGTDAHLCWTYSQGVLCFVPPFGGG